jgi:integrase
MKGSIHYDKHSKRFLVLWYDEPTRKAIKIWFYKGIKLETRNLAEKLLASMQGDVENNCFRLEKYTLNETDVIPYLESWLEAVKSTLSPATYKDYKGSINNHLKPFFRKRLVQLSEIQYDTIMELMSSINRVGKGKLNVVMCLHACLKYAWKSKRIASMPPFPEKGKYDIVEPKIRWLPEVRQDKVIEAIPMEDQPIFWFLKYSLRRPAEAMALRKEDLENGVFTVRRGISDYQEIDRTKDKHEHLIPMVSALEPWLKYENDKQKDHGIVSPYVFVSLRSRKAGKRYTARTMQRIWKEACKATGETIDMYHGTKHSRASQLLNEYGLSKSELKEAGDWARMDSVDKYAETEVATRLNLLEGKFGKSSDSVRTLSAKRKVLK